MDAEYVRLAAMSERAKRERARRDLRYFIEYTTPWWRPARHLVVLCKALTMVERGEIDRLMTFMPPRNGKSAVISVPFPAWWLGRHPDNGIIHASYADALSNKFSRQARGMIRGLPEYHTLFRDVALSDDSKSVQQWELAAPYRGSFKSVGMTSGVTGHGGELIIIDDPIKGREAADSQVQREAVMDVWRNDLLTRLHPGGAIVATLTRWHPEDWAGQVLAEAAEEAGLPSVDHAPPHPLLPEAKQVGEWAVISFPAVAEEGDPLGRKPGEPLWPERWPASALERIRTGMHDERAWFSLMQQRPMVESGNMFTLDMFADRWTTLPSVIERVITFWDGAAKDKQQNDEWAGCTGAVGKNGFVYVLNVTAGRWTAPKAEAVVVEIHRAMAKRWGDRYEDCYEDASGMVAVAQYVPRDHPDVALIPVPTAGKDVVEHANSVLKFFAAHRVLFPAGWLPWVQPTLDQLLPFPAVTHDDRVTAVVKMVQRAVQGWELIPSGGGQETRGPSW